jgi:2-oxoglutarate ferredoxin oxidoreductase subunit gamma
VVSESAIGSPVIDHPSSIAVLNRPSLEKFGPRVKHGGLLIINTSLIELSSDRQDIRQLSVPANAMALECGTGKAANMAILGAYVGYSRAVSLDSLKPLVRRQFERKPQFIDVNLNVLTRGYELGAAAAGHAACQ